MIRQITRISIGQTSKVIALCYAVVALVGVVIYWVFMRGLMRDSGAASPGAIILILVPVLYGVIVFIVTSLMFFIYNQVAAKVGGVEFDVSDTAPPA
jgi:drug/metabolite transporter (DMT)-like permease